MRRLPKLVFGNFGLKLFALALSFLLWRSYMAEPFAQVGYDVPIAFVNVPPGFAVGGDAPAAARIVVAGRSGLLQRLRSTDLTFTVDLNDAPPGQTRVRLAASDVRLPYGTEVVYFTPAEFRVTLVPTTAPLPPPE